MMEFDKLYWEMQQWWVCASDEARNNFIHKLNQERSPSPSPVYETDNRQVDYSYCVDFSNDMYRLGKKIVYIYAKPNGIPFYVGMGDPYRPFNIYNRSDDFLSEFDKSQKAKVFIITVNASNSVASEIETLCIWLMIEKSWSLCNSAKTNIDYDSFGDLKEEYKEIVSLVNELNDYFLQNVLEEGFTDEKFVTKTDKDERYKSKNVWEINGKVNYASYWCNKFGVSVSWVLQRIVKFGLTPNEAITFPKATDGKPYIQPMIEFWRGKGCFPGTDTTSRIVSINYCGFTNVDDLL